MNLMHLGWRAVMNDKPYVKELVGDIASMSKLHAELFIAEARFEVARLKRKAILLMTAAALLAIAVIFFLAAIVASFWETAYRFHALFGVPFSLVMMAIVISKLGQSQTSVASPFAQSIAEFKKDADWLANLL